MTGIYRGRFMRLDFEESGELLLSTCQGEELSLDAKDFWSTVQEAMDGEGIQTARIKELESRLTKAEEIVIASIDMLDDAENTRVRVLSMIIKEARDFIAAKKGE